MNIYEGLFAAEPPMHEHSNSYYNPILEFAVHIVRIITSTASFKRQIDSTCHCLVSADAGLHD